MAFLAERKKLAFRADEMQIYFGGGVF